MPVHILLHSPCKVSAGIVHYGGVAGRLSRAQPWRKPGTVPTACGQARGTWKGLTRMPVQLTMCRLCAQSRPEFLQTIARLAAAHPDALVVEELECMAACDDVPAIMLETDYHPQLSPTELSRIIELRLREPMTEG